MSITLEAANFLRGFAASKAFLEAEAMVKERVLAGRVVNRAQALAPVLTGKLRESIRIQGEGVDNGKPFIDVGSTVDYAAYVEYGTVTAPAHPFLRPALAEEGG